MYPYMKLADETEIIHSQLFNEDGVQKFLFTLSALRKMALIPPGVSCLPINGFITMVTLKMKSIPLRGSCAKARISFINMLQMEGFTMPVPFTASGYKIYF